MEAVAHDVTTEAELRDLIESWRVAAQAKDLDRIVAHYAPDILAFDAIAQLQFKGVEAYRKHWEACLAMCPGAMIFELHDLSIEAGDGVAFAHGLSRCGTIKENGEEQAGWMRMTAGYRRTNAGWKVVHEHFSAPFDVASGKALFDLEP